MIWCEAHLAQRRSAEPATSRPGGAGAAAAAHAASASPRTARSKRRCLLPPCRRRRRLCAAGSAAGGQCAAAACALPPAGRGRHRGGDRSSAGRWPLRRVGGGDGAGRPQQLAMPPPRPVRWHGSFRAAGASAARESPAGRLVRRVPAHHHPPPNVNKTPALAKDLRSWHRSITSGTHRALAIQPNTCCAASFALSRRAHDNGARGRRDVASRSRCIARASLHLRNSRAACQSMRCAERRVTPQESVRAHIAAPRTRALTREAPLLAARCCVRSSARRVAARARAR
jgi:hypothetical protein